MRSDPLPPDEFSESYDDMRVALGLPPKPGWW